MATKSTTTNHEPKRIFCIPVNQEVQTPARVQSAVNGANQKAALSEDRLRRQQAALDTRYRLLTRVVDLLERDIDAEIGCLLRS